MMPFFKHKKGNNTAPQIAFNKVEITNKTQTSISIRWNKATDKETAQNQLIYCVTWCVSPYNMTHKKGEALIDCSSYTIKGLAPNTHYDIIVYARDLDGGMTPYATVQTSTMPDTKTANTAPIIPNKNVRVIKQNSKSLIISWQKATDNETAQTMLQYSVAIYLVSGNNAHNLQLVKQSPWMKDISSYRLSNLTPETTYCINVMVYDGETTSRYNPAYVRTPELRSETGNPELDRKNDINNGLAKIGYNANFMFNGTLYNENDTYPEAIESLPDREAAYLLTKKANTINEKEVYVRGSHYINIYPGAILIVDDKITTGDPNPLGGIKRNKISIYGDFLASTSTIQNDVEPDNENVREHTNEIMRILLKDPSFEPSGHQELETKIYTSQKSMMLDFAVDASFAGCNVNVKAKTTSEEQSFIHATTLHQDYFTVTMKDTWTQDPSSLFDKSVTWDQLKEKLNGKAIAIVTSVTYGRTFSYLREYNAKKFTFDGSQKVKAWGQNASAEERINTSSSYDRSEIFNLGGTALSASVLKAKEKDQHTLESLIADNLKFGPSNQGVVTKYTLQLITGPNPGKIIKPKYSGTQYEIDYIRCPRKLEAHVNISNVKNASKAGGSVKVEIIPQCFWVIGGRPIRFLPKSNYEWWFQFDHSRNRTYGGDMQPGEYIFKNPQLKIYSKIPGGRKYTPQDSMDLGREIESGKIDIVLKGNTYSSVTIKKVSAQDENDDQ